MKPEDILFGSIVIFLLAMATAIVLDGHHCRPEAEPVTPSARHEAIARPAARPDPKGGL